MYTIYVCLLFKNHINVIHEVKLKIIIAKKKMSTKSFSLDKKNNHVMSIVRTAEALIYDMKYNIIQHVL